MARVCVILLWYIPPFGACAVCTLGGKGVGRLCSEAQSAPPRHQQKTAMALWIAFNPGKPGNLRILLAADLNIAGLANAGSGGAACGTTGGDALVRLHRFRRWWRRHWGNAGNVTMTGIANCRQAVGIPSLNAPMYRLHSSSLAILPTVLNPPSGSLKNAVQVLRFGSYAKQLTYGPLYCCIHSVAVG